MIGSQRFGYQMGANIAERNPKASVAEPDALKHVARIVQRWMYRSGYALPMIEPQESFVESFCHGFRVIRWTQQEG